MKTRRVIAGATVILLLATLAVPGGAQTPTFKPEELEQIVAPIALYPDPLIAQIFMASTYPVEVVQAARFAKANPSLKGEALDAELQKQTWDDSVKALVSFPQVVAMMSEKLDWTQKVGDAFLGQQKDVMDAVQRLRSKAQASGNLKSTPEQKVIVEPAPPAAAAPQTQTTIIKIEPANPQVVYVPTYQPTVVYGAWPYPAYPPYAYYPPGYVAGAALLSFGVGMAVGSALWGNCNWGGGNVDIDVNRQNTFNRNVNHLENRTQRTGAQGGNRDSWQHDPSHRKGAQYRDANTQQRFNKSGAPDAASREAFRGRAEQGRQDLARGGGDRAGGGAGNRGGDRAGTSDRAGGGIGDRGGAGVSDRAGGGIGDRAGGGGGAGRGGDRLGAGGAGTRERGQGFGDGGGAGNRGSGGAFDGVGQGRAARDSSQRGASSLGSARASGSQGGGISAASRGGGGGARQGAGGGGGARQGGGGRGGRR